jgi:hypothetical protein
MRAIIRSIVICGVFLGTAQSPLFAQRVGPVRSMHPSNDFFYFGLPPGGNFAHATLGNFTLGSSQFMPAQNGTSLLVGRGYFLPTNGTFVPTPLGNFSLVTREAFNPMTRTLMPSPTGNVLLATRGDLISSTTKTPVNSVVPVLPAVNPSVMVNPYAGTMVNPYMPGAMATSPYAAMPYPNGSSYGTPMYTNTATSPIATTQATPKSTSDTTSATPAQIALGAYGISMNAGHIDWPLAFRLLSPDKKRELTDPLESQLLALAGQSSGATLNPAFSQEVKQNVDRLSAWLTAHQTDIAEATYQDGVAFLKNVKATVKALNQ